MMTIIQILVVLSVAATFLPMIRTDRWWIRVFDFPRLQILSFMFIIAFVHAFLISFKPVNIIEITVLICGIIYQVNKIWRFTRFHPIQVTGTESGVSKSNISLITANVLMHNRNHRKLLQIIEQNHPDIVFLVETDQWWEDHLQELDQKYPHSIKCPKDNTYGMHLYSKLDLEETEINYIIEDSVPSFATKIESPSGQKIQFFGIHPRPPRPQKHQHSTERDAELVIYAQKCRDISKPIIIMGDFNDIPWSYTSRLFQKISGLLDPRIGRGFYNSFPVKYQFMRFALDHVFHSGHFKLIEMKRLPDFGSDHFPIFISLFLDHNSEATNKKPKMEREDVEAANDYIQKAKVNSI